MSNKTQHGIALMTVIMFLFIMSLTWLSFSFISSYESDVLQKQVASEQASYVAEAGIQQALYFLSQDWDWQHWPQHGYIPVPGGNLTQGSPTYYQWSGTLGDSNQTYTVQIRNDGKIQSKIKVGSPNLDSPKRTIEVELGSAFDFGLYSHDQMKFSSGFTVSGTNATGYAYAKNGITNPAFLTVDKKVGNYSTAPYFLPKEIPLPSCGTSMFEAKISDASDTTVHYINEDGEEHLEINALLRNKTKSNFRIISAFDNGSKTITAAEHQEETDYPEKKWAAGDDIVLERIKKYEDENTRLNDFVYASPPDINAVFGPSGTSQTFPVSPSTSAEFTNGTVTFNDNTTFEETIKIDGDATFNANTTINGDVIVKGTATFNSNVQINGSLYVNKDVAVTGGALTVGISPTAPQEKALYIRNGSLTIGSSSSSQNLSGWGKIIVGRNVEINGRLSTTDSTKPMKIIAMGDMEIGDRGIGSWSFPFYGIIYCGGKLYHTNPLTSPRTRIKGLLMAGTYYYKRPDNSEYKFFFLRSVVYDANMKQDMPALGFTNNEDFVRPLFWRDTTE
jgi:hypothetical protein